MYIEEKCTTHVINLLYYKMYRNKLYNIAYYNKVWIIKWLFCFIFRYIPCIIVTICSTPTDWLPAPSGIEPPHLKRNSAYTTWSKHKEDTSLPIHTVRSNGLIWSVDQFKSHPPNTNYRISGQIFHSLMVHSSPTLTNQFWDLDRLEQLESSWTDLQWDNSKCPQMEPQLQTVVCWVELARAGATPLLVLLKFFSVYLFCQLSLVCFKFFFLNGYKI